MKVLHTGRARGPSKGLCIGITVGLREGAESLWINGIKQNALYLAKMFSQSARCHRVLLVNTTGIALDGALPWDREAFPTFNLPDVAHELDVLIELGGQISADATEALKSRGAKLVSYCCGPEYVQNMEAIVFGRRMYDSIFINQCYDEIWVIPQNVRNSLGFFSALRRAPVREVPFVWDPMCLEARCHDLPDQGEYRPGEHARRLSIMEPNIDVVKFCLYPMLIADLAFREAPEKIGFLHVTNAEQLVNGSPEFVSLARYLDIVKANKASFVGRHDTPTFLKSFTDVVISHQWDLPLNYFYFDVCWNGYALVHNANLCQEIGYYYPDNDVEAGRAQLMRVLQEHDRDWDRYRIAQRQKIGRFLATDAALVRRYDELLDELMTRGA
ncbi:DUF2827 domain-containing protein [Paraburkholderia heleia]|uniref:DUF2827 domain-containing protein n=1 Tax=Paraburkholderia heleia TaxID=634127 RepID=UPI002AB7B575|nr:DUF2827 domain-containing protein [Paraburkholderia heleia]